MARIASQIKSVSSLVLAAAASVCFGLAARRFDANSHWLPVASAGLLMLLCQMGLIFVDSKEDVELAQLKKQRDDKLAHDAAVEKATSELPMAERNAISLRIRSEIQSGTLEEAENWVAFGERHGK